MDSLIRIARQDLSAVKDLLPIIKMFLDKCEETIAIIVEREKENEDAKAQNRNNDNQED